MSAATTFLHVQYAPLLEVVVAHEYYDQQYCPYIALVPSPACAALLRQYRLRFLPTPQGGKLMGQTPAIVPLPTAAMVFEFYLRGSNDEFLAVTAMGDGPGQSAGGYRFAYAEGAWVKPLGEPAAPALPLGIRAVLQVEVALTPGTPLRVQLPLQTPMVSWRYYIVTGADYAANDLQIAENSTLVSNALTPPAAEAETIARRFADKRITALGVTLKLKKDFPAWYLVTAAGNAVAHVADVPPLPKPRPGALPHLILDYSSILK